MNNVLLMIGREMKRKHITITELSRRMKLHQSTVSGMLNRSSIKVKKLAELCKVLEYNFFREIAEKLPYEEPVYDSVNKERELELLGQIKKLEEENKILNIKVNVLEDVISRLK